MPRSSPEGKQQILQWLAHLPIKRICDVGAGCGTYRDLCGLHGVLPNAHWTALEVWEPYVQEFQLRTKYDEVVIKDVREADLSSYDLLIFGDVLEHMTREEAKKCVASAPNAWKILSIPTSHYPQAAVYENPFEVHVEEDWEPHWVFEDFATVADSQIGDISVYFLRPDDAR